MILFTLFLFFISIPSEGASLKPRLVVLTDISSWEPDDHESLIRLMVHADVYEIEGIVVTTGISAPTSLGWVIRIVESVSEASRHTCDIF